MPHIVHALPESAAATLETEGEYRPDSLEREGFVHCSKPGQIVAVADAVHAGEDDLVLLVLDEDLIDAPVRYEVPEGGESAFPHVYGPIDADWVVDVVDFPRDETGFRLPEELLAY